MITQQLINEARATHDELRKRLKASVPGTSQYQRIRELYRKSHDRFCRRFRGWQPAASEYTAALS
jgi:hypothetical protein